MMELLERVPRSVATSGRYARDYFTRDGRWAVKGPLSCRLCMPARGAS